MTKKNEATLTALFALHKIYELNPPQGAVGVIWLGGAAIRAGYKNTRASHGGYAHHLSMPTLLLREVLADQSDRGHRASVIGWCATVECQGVSAWMQTGAQRKSRMQKMGSEHNFVWVF